MNLRMEADILLISKTWYRGLRHAPLKMFTKLGVYVSHIERQKFVHNISACISYSMLLVGSVRKRRVLDM